MLSKSDAVDDDDVDDLCTRTNKMAAFGRSAALGRSIVIILVLRQWDNKVRKPVYSLAQVRLVFPFNFPICKVRMG